jgi:hypothetical protein
MLGCIYSQGFSGQNAFVLYILKKHGAHLQASCIPACINTDEHAHTYSQTMGWCDLKHCTYLETSAKSVTFLEFVLSFTRKSFGGIFSQMTCE